MNQNKKGQSSDAKQPSKPENNKYSEAPDELLGEKIENPAAKSEAGPDIYDIGMGGPGATSSGLRDRADRDEDE
jgi:hypothetical protein